MEKRKKKVVNQQQSHISLGNCTRGGLRYRAREAGRQAQEQGKKRLLFTHRSHMKKIIRREKQKPQEV